MASNSNFSNTSANDGLNSVVKCDHSTHSLASYGNYSQVTRWQTNANMNRCKQRMYDLFVSTSTKHNRVIERQARNLEVSS